MVREVNEEKLNIFFFFGVALFWGRGSINFYYQGDSCRDFPGGPVIKTLCSQCRGPRFYPWLGNQIPQAVTKTQGSPPESDSCTWQKKKKKIIFFFIKYRHAEESSISFLQFAASRGTRCSSFHFRFLLWSLPWCSYTLAIECLYSSVFSRETEPMECVCGERETEKKREELQGLAGTKSAKQARRLR